MQSWNQWGGGGGGMYNYQTAPATATSTPSTDVHNYGSNYQYYSTAGSTDASQMDMSAYNQQQQQYTLQQQQQWQQWTQWQQQFQQWQQQYGDKYQQAMGGMPVSAPPPAPSGAAYNPSVQPPLPPLPPSDKPVNPPLPSEPPLPPPQPLQPPLPPNQMPPTQAPHSQPPPVPPVSQSQVLSSSVSHQQPSQPPLPPQQPQPTMPPPLLSTHHPPPPPVSHMHHQGYHQGQMYPGSNYGAPYEGQESNQGGYYPRSNAMGENYGGSNQYSVAPPYGGDEYEVGGGGYEGRKRPMGGGNDGSFGSQVGMGGKKMRMDIPPPSDKGSDKEHRDNWSSWGGDEGGRGGGGRMESAANQHAEANKPLSSLKPKEAPDEELSEAEKSFDAQFVQWESQFMRWKEQNKNHSDKNQYREYEAKWESWREQLLQRREQMKKKRENGKATSDGGSVGPRTGMSPFAKMPPILPEKSPEAHAGDVPRSTLGGERWWSGPPPDHSREQEGGMGRYEGRGGRDGMREGGGGGMLGGSRGGEGGMDGRFDGRWSTGGDSAGDKPVQKLMGAKEDAPSEIQHMDDKDIIDMPKEEHSNDKNGDDISSGASKLGLMGVGGSGKGIPGLDLVMDPNAMNAECREENNANGGEFLVKEKEENEDWHRGDKEEKREEGNWFSKRSWGDPEGGPGNQGGGLGEDSQRNQGMGSQRPMSIEREGNGKGPWKTGMHRNQSGMFCPPDKPMHGNRMHNVDEDKNVWQNQRQHTPHDMYGPPPDTHSPMGPLGRMLEGRPPLDADMRGSEENKPWNNQQRGPQDMMGPMSDSRMMSGRPIGSDMRESDGKPWQNQHMGPGDMFGPPPGMRPPGGHLMDSDMRNESPKKWQSQPRGLLDYGPPDVYPPGRGAIDSDMRDFNKPWGDQRGPPQRGPHDIFEQSDMRQDSGRMIDTDIREDMNKPWQNRGPPELFGPGMRSLLGDGAQQQNMKPVNQGLSKQSPFVDNSRFQHGDMRPLSDSKHPRGGDFDPNEPREDMYPRGRGDWDVEGGGFPRSHWRDDHPRNQRYDEPPREGWGDMRGPSRLPMDDDPFDHDHRAFFDDQDQRRRDDIGVGPEKGGPPRRGDHGGRSFGLESERFRMGEDERWEFRERRGMEQPLWDPPEEPPPRHSPPPHPVRDWEATMGAPTVIDYGHVSRVDVVPEPVIDRAPTPPRNIGGSVQTFDYGHGAARNPVPFVVECAEREQWRGNEYGDRDSRVMSMNEPSIPRAPWERSERSPPKGRNFEPPVKENQRRESRWEKPRWSNTKHNDADRWEGEERHSTGSERWSSSSQSRKDRDRDRDEKRGERDRDRERDRDKDRERDRDRDRGRKGRPRLDEERSGSSGGGSGSRGHDSEKDKDRDRSSSSRHKKDDSSSSRTNNGSGNANSSNPSVSASGSAGSHSVVSYPAQSTNSPPPPPVISQQSQPSLAKIETVLIEDLLVPPGRANRPSRIVIILRGPPGSGKTFVAKLVKDKEVEQGGSAPRILSLDDYFMVEFEKEEKDPETGRKVTKKFMKYEYEPEMEKQYRNSLIKALRKTVDDGYFPFIIVDCINDKVRQFDEMWTYAKQKGFQVYICEMDMDVSTCSKRNTHGRNQRDIEDMVKHWEETPRSYVRVDVRSLLQSVAITEVEMEDSTEEKETKQEEKGTEEKDKEQGGDAEEDAEKIVVTSKWEGMEASEEKLDRLDGLAKKRRTENHPQSLEDWLQLPDDYEKRKCTPGKKQVRWADLEERRRQERIRAIGFVVGQTDWSRMTDPTFGEGALTQTKYI